jgi:nucleoside-diphosphate-sugar epimerase
MAAYKSVILVGSLLCMTSLISALGSQPTIAVKAATVFGATGGLGQWCCKLLLDSGYDVNAVTRFPNNVAPFVLLKGCKIKQADARELDDALISSVKGVSTVIISVGTTGTIEYQSSMIECN